MALPTDIANSINQQGQNVLVTGQRFKRFDQIRQRHFWSTYRFTVDTNGYVQSGDYELFQTPQGQQGQGFNRQLSLKETNWPSSNRVADNQNLEITEIGCSCTLSFGGFQDGVWAEAPLNFQMPNFAMANALLLDNTIVNITYLTNTIPLGMCSDFAQAAGPQMGFYAPGAPLEYPLPPGTNVAETDNSRAYYTNGFASPGLRRRWKIPILLQHGETFRFTLQVSPGRGPFMSPPAPGPISELQALLYDLRLDFWATESFVEKS